MGSKASLSCPPWITLFVPQKQILFWPYNQSFTDQACLVEMSKINITHVFSLTSAWYQYIKMQKGLGQQPAILTAHLVNNA